MWETATMSFAFAGIASIAITEVLRGIVRRRRLQRQGIGDTQDVALWGTVATAICSAGTVISGVGWLFTR
jgi:hypothetical protein